MALNIWAFDVGRDATRLSKLKRTRTVCEVFVSKRQTDVKMWSPQVNTVTEDRSQFLSCTLGEHEPSTTGSAYLLFLVPHFSVLKELKGVKCEASDVTPSWWRRLQQHRLLELWVQGVGTPGGGGIKVTPNATFLQLQHFVLSRRSSGEHYTRCKEESTQRFRTWGRPHSSAPGAPRSGPSC